MIYGPCMDLQRLSSLRPIDDEFMRCLFKDNIPLAELVLRIITGKQDLVITDCQTQKDMKRLVEAKGKQRCEGRVANLLVFLLILI